MLQEVQEQDAEDCDDFADNPFVTHAIRALGNKRKEPPKAFIALDTEDDSEGNVTIVNFYDGKDHHTFWREMGADYLERACRELIGIASRTKNCVIVAHNLEYDLNNLFRWADWAFVEEMRYSSRLITAKLTGISAECWDSFNLCPTSLKNMAKVIGREKGDYEEARSDLASNIGYCQSDCEILWEFMDKFQSLCIESIQTGIRPTIGGLAMRAWRKNHMGAMAYAASSTPLALEAYYGGRTEAFHIGEVGRTIVSDVRSMYPTAMLQPYPDCSTLEPSRLATHKYGVGRFRIRVPHTMHIPPLPYRFDGRLFFPTGDLVGAWVYAEVRHAVEQGCIVLEELPGSYGTNQGGNYLADYVHKFYDLRCKARREKDAFGLTFFKLLLNHLYGKFCMNRPRTIVAKSCPAIKPGKVLHAVRTLGPFGVWEEEAERPADTTNFLWGAYVTAYSRIHLHTLLVGVHEQGHNTLYCDTDSVMFEPIHDGRPYEIGEALGMMEEEEYLDGKFITAKGYYLRYQEDGEDKYKIACKGVPNKLAMEFFAQGVAKVWRPVKMREGFVQQLKANVWREVTKRAITTYLKRKVERGGATRPWRVAELPRVIKRLKKETEDE